MSTSSLLLQPRIVWGVVLVTIPLVACADSAPGPALDTVDLTGTWVLRDASTSTVPSDPPIENPCIVTGEAFDLARGSGDSLWYAQQATGGHVRCWIGDSLYADQPTLNIEKFYYVTRRGDSVFWVRGDLKREFLGRLRSTASMSGARDAASMGRGGTWSARRGP
jgi:hypothetical protein